METPTVSVEVIDSLESRTVTHYAYDKLGRVTQETKLHYKPEPKPTTSIFALEAVYVEHGQSPPEGFVIADKSHIYAKGTVYVKLPEEQTSEPQEKAKSAGQYLQPSV